ncbi:MAG: transporter related, partial [Nitrospirae bacterium]|nr:transporter related [Nitrospirota bacterium]
GRIIDDLAFAIGGGEFIGLLGANGSGKSTILKLAAGMLRPDRGIVKLWDKPLAAYRNKDRAKLLCYFPQHLDVSVPFTVREIVGMGMYPYDIPPVMTVDEAMDTVGLLDKADVSVTNLSGGERRRVFIAMTLIQGAGILLLDEPLANLDIRYQIEFLRLLRRLQEQKGISVVMALHDINVALQFEKVMVIKNGSVLGTGSPEAVLTGAMIQDAFDVAIEVRKAEHGTYITHEKWF